MFRIIYISLPLFLSIDFHIFISKISYKKLIPVWREIYNNYRMAACISQVAKQM